MLGGRQWREGDGGRASARGTALAGSTGWQALTQVWLAGMRTIQDVRTRLLALICPFTTFTLAIARPHGLCDRYFRVLFLPVRRPDAPQGSLSASYGTLARRRPPEPEGFALPGSWRFPSPSGGGIGSWDSGMALLPAGGVPGEVSCAVQKANSTPESGHYAKGPPHEQQSITVSGSRDPTRNRVSISIR